jgi:multidrug efflux system membrane fusion protein
MISKLSANKNIVTALIVAILLLIWLGSGFITAPFESEPAKNTQQKNELVSVRARYIQAQAFDRLVRVSARTEAKRSVDVRAEIAGRVVALPVEKGHRVEQGTLLCQLAVEDRKLRVQQNKSLVDRAQLEYDGALRLKSGGYQSRTTIAAKKAELETAKANLERSELDLGNLGITAPYDGVFIERHVEMGDLVQRGDVCGTVIDLNPLVVAGEVSATEVEQLTLGSTVSIRMLSGELLPGQLTYIGHRADTVTRAYRIEVETPNSDNLYRSGITAQMTIPVAEVMAHQISSALLSLDDQGGIGVRILDENNQVHFVNVQLVGSHTGGVWVVGLPEKTLLITVGQEYVTEGQQVSVSLEQAVETSALRP